MEIQIKDLKEMLEIKNSVTEMKDTFDGSLIDLTQLRRESVSLKIGQ